jgi:hypothetical protein
MSLIQIALRLASSPKDWKLFLDQKYDGGKAMVRNPNPETAKRYPEISVNTALKNESFRAHIEKEYEQWKGSQKTPETKQDPVWDKHQTLLGKYTIESMTKKFKKEWVEAGKKLESFKDSLDYNFYLNKELSSYEKEPDRYKGTRFEKAVKTVKDIDPNLIEGYKFYAPEYHYTYSKAFFEAWSWSSGGDLPLNVAEYLASLGVSGTLTNYEGISRKERGVKPIRKAEMVDVHRIYAYQQAVFKHLGIKEITLYRGVQIDTDLPNDEDTVKVQSRTIASWTSNPIVASTFGNRTIKCTIPVERIFGSASIYRPFDGSRYDSIHESEFIVLGSSDLDCTIL